MCELQELLKKHNLTIGKKEDLIQRLIDHDSYQNPTKEAADLTPELLQKLDAGSQGPPYDSHAVAYLPGFQVSTPPFSSSYI